MADLLPLGSEAAVASASNASATAAALDGSAYHYPAGSDEVSPLDVLTALRRYGAAESDMRKRTRKSMSMNDTDLAALRYLLNAQAGGRSMGAKDLASLLEISSASVSVMLERLERHGHVQRSAHPTDRRASIIEATEAGAAEVAATLGPLHGRMLEVAEAMPDEDVVAVHRFLTAMIVALEAIDPPHS